jgi:predicted nucleic acid-binding protein
MLLIDTCILIDFLRGEPPALKFLQTMRQEAVLSAINVAELMAGRMKAKEEVFVQELYERHQIFPVDVEIAVLGGVYVRQYGPSHGTGIMDALLAATATIKKCTFVTRNKKHFPMLGDIIIPW